MTTKKEEILSKLEPHLESREWTGDSRRHRDVTDIRRRFGIPAWSQVRSEFEKHGVMVDLLEHTWDAGPDQAAGGTDVLGTGKPGTGKSTQILYFAARLMEINEEAVVWRGSSSRSEWLPFAPWTRLCLPKGCEVEAWLEPKNPKNDRIQVEPGDVVREVVRYDSPHHLNQELLEPGMFHVVYPDPEMKGCQEVYEEAAEKVYEAPADRDELFHPEDPSHHWWFAWVLDRVENGPYSWVTWMADEIGDLAPQSARSDGYSTYQKVELFKDCFVDARKTGLSIFAYGHSEVDIHQLVRHKIRWRISMPKSANPTSKSEVVGFNSVKMDSDMTSRYPIGKALVFTENAFDRFRWKDVPSAIDYKLKLRLRPRIRVKEGVSA